MAAIDKFHKVGASTATTLSSPGYTIGATSINVAATTNMPTDTGVTITIDEVDGNGARIAGTRNVFIGDVAGATQINELAYTGGDANRNYSAGATTRVYIEVNEVQMNRMIDGVLVQHNQNGTHKAITAPSAVFTGDVEAASFTLTGAGGAAGWEVGLPAPDTVTNNGNRSYDLVFNGTDLTDTVSEGMRLRTTRTVAAPTQCADLNGSNHYFNNTTPAGTTFTDDFVAGAWVKLEAYGASQTIVSRFNNTSGWKFNVNTDGTLQLVGYNASNANFSRVLSYQSIPLNKWVHITAQLDMSAFTATTTTSYIMIDGVNVPAQVTRGGTNPTALVQAGNLEVGGDNGGGNPFNGKLAQVFYSSAKITQANVQTLMSQGLTAALISTHSIVSAYSLSNDITDLNTTSANDLSAQNSAVATNVDSPFGNYLGGTLDYGIITKTAFSTDTTLTVQVPEGCTIPTSGGVSAVAYSTQSVPYGFVRDEGRWEVGVNLNGDGAKTTATQTWNNFRSFYLSVPVGGWKLNGFFTRLVERGTSTYNDSSALSEATTSITPGYETTITFDRGATGVGGDTHQPEIYKKYTSQTTVYVLVSGVYTTTSYASAQNQMNKLTAIPAYL